MLQLKIDRALGWLGIAQSWGYIEVNTTPADIKIVTKPTTLEIDIDWPVVRVDQTQSLASMGYKNVIPFQKDIAEKAQSILLAGIKRTAREGDRLGRIEANGNPLPEIAEAAAWPEKDYNVAITPKIPPNISSTGGVCIKAVRGEIAVEAKTRLPQISAQKGNLDVYVKVKPSIEIEVIGQWINLLG